MEEPPVDEIYSRQPRCFERGVPVFIDRQNDAYIENYDQISSDHIASIERGNGNPFIDSKIWTELERNTLVQGGQYVQPGMTVLDVGVGTGRLLSHFPEARRYGIDISINYVQRLVDSGAKVAVGNLEELPYVDGAFDVVFCTDVLEHVENILFAARELVRVTKPGGILIVRVPYKEDLSPYLDKDCPYRLAHLRNFDEHGLRLLFERQIGVTTVRIDYDYSMAPSLFRLAIPRGRTVLTRMISAVVDMAPKLEFAAVRCFFRPVEITMTFCRSS
jgi:SAM-dependent methyltransferase